MTVVDVRSNSRNLAVFQLGNNGTAQHELKRWDLGAEGQAR